MKINFGKKDDELNNRMKKIDLHLHTDCSDGRLSAENLLKLCSQKGYKTISITDHDTIDGYLNAKALVDEYELTLIPGLEVSSYHNDSEVHILVYYFDENDSGLIELLRYINDSRINRAKKIIHNLNSIGFKLDFDHIFSKTGNSGIIGRTHIAREIMKIKKGVTVNDVFDQYLNENSDLFEPKVTVSVKEIIPIIKKAGGIAVIAHPHRLRRQIIINDIIRLGIEGIEVYCPKSSNYHINLFRKIAEDNGLLITGGSDFHCEPYEVELFGTFSVPQKCLDNLNSYHTEELCSKSQKTTGRS